MDDIQTTRHCSFTIIINQIQFEMTDFIEKTKHFVTNVSHEEGIKGLIKLQHEAPEKMKYIPRLACLSLMEMCHDWQGIRKLIVQWKLVSKFGKQLVIRMRKRVGEQPGSQSDDYDSILKELDRLNDKNWRQFSPKRNLPDYPQLVAEMQVKESKQIQPPTLSSINQQKQVKEQSEKHIISFDPKSERSSIFSKISQFQKSDSKDKDIFTRGVFSKQQNQRNQNIEKPSQNIDKKQSVQDVSQGRADLKKQQIVSDASKKSDSGRHITPTKDQPKKIISLKYGNEKQKLIQEAKDQFSFSVVKARQQGQGLSNKKQYSANKGDQLNDSFLNFTNQSKLIKKQSEEVFFKNDDILLEVGIGKQSYRSSIRYKQAKPLYTEQELALIDMNVPAQNYIKQIFKVEGKSALDMLKIQLTSH